MVRAEVDAPGELQRAAELLFKNWMLALPTAVSSVVISALLLFAFAGAIGSIAISAAALGHGGAALGAVFGALPLLLVFLVVAVVVSALAHATVVRAAEDVWEGRPLDLGSSFGAAASRAVPLIAAYIIIAAIVTVLSVTLVGIILLPVVAYFVMYTLPAIVLGGQSAIASISTSFRLAKDNVSTSLVAFLGIVIALVVAGLVNGVFRHLPILNLVSSLVVGGFVYAFIALVAARFYTLLAARLPEEPLATPPPVA